MTGNTAPVEVRRIGADDWRDWRRLRLRALADTPAAFGSTLAHEQEFSVGDWRQRAGDGSFLGYAGALPVAIGAGFQDRPGHLMVVAMWTEPAWRGRGVGGQVLDAIVEYAGTLGLRPHLFAMQANPEAARLYLRHGFARSGLTEDHGGRPADELVHAGTQADP